MKKEVSWIVSEYNARLRTMTCPACKKSNVKIINDGKPDESSLYDYLGAHGPQGNLCVLPAGSISPMSSRATSGSAVCH